MATPGKVNICVRLAQFELKNVTARQNITDAYFVVGTTRPRREWPGRQHSQKESGVSNPSNRPPLDHVDFIDFVNHRLTTAIFQRSESSQSVYTKATVGFR